MFIHFPSQSGRNYQKVDVLGPVLRHVLRADVPGPGAAILGHGGPRQPSIRPAEAPEAWPEQKTRHGGDQVELSWAIQISTTTIYVCIYFYKYIYI